MNKTITYFSIADWISAFARIINIRISRQACHNYHLISILFLMIFLSSCSHVSKQDGPPHFYVDESKVPDATPKHEPLSKYGNMSSYRVFGKRYYTLKSSKHYEAVGIASWYGTRFHARSTSSGERYNMLAMTAAHKTLPLPTYVEVTNLKNHRKIIVKVNDRGPFEANRLIDLSYVAAKKLGMLGHGTAYVKVKAIDPYSLEKPILLAKNTRKTPTPRTILVTRSHYPNRVVYLQVGAFRNKLHAEKLRQRLTALLTAPVKIAHPSLRNKLYRVEIGPINDVATVNKITLRLRNLGMKPNKIF